MGICEVLMSRTCLDNVARSDYQIHPNISRSQSWLVSVSLLASIGNKNICCLQETLSTENNRTSRFQMCPVVVPSSCARWVIIWLAAVTSVFFFWPPHHPLLILVCLTKEIRLFILKQPPSVFSPLYPSGVNKW